MALPTKKSAWKSAAEDQGLLDKTIYDIEDYDSGSKIGEYQYLALRSFWVPAEKRKFNPSEVGIQDVDKADRWLKSRPDWVAYLKNLESAKGSVLPAELGSFSICSLTRRQIDGVREVDDVDKINTTPWSRKLRTRRTDQSARSRSESPSVAVAQRRLAALSIGQGAKAVAVEQVSEGVSATGILDEDYRSLGAESESEPELELQSPQAASDYQPSPRTAARLFPAVEDEQIVNFFLFALLSCLSFHWQDSMKFEWSVLRKAFVFGTGEDSCYQARTDGHLFATNSHASTAESLVILEVKPTHRTGRTVRKIVYQATAQMAAWIFAEPHVLGPKCYRYVWP